MEAYRKRWRPLRHKANRHYANDVPDNRKRNCKENEKSPSKPCRLVKIAIAHRNSQKCADRSKTATGVGDINAEHLSICDNAWHCYHVAVTHNLNTESRENFACRRTHKEPERYRQKRKKRRKGHTEKKTGHRK